MLEMNLKMKEFCQPIDHALNWPFAYIVNTQRHRNTQMLPLKGIVFSEMNRIKATLE